MLASRGAQPHRRIVAIDALRGLAAAAVVCHHVFTVFQREVLALKTDYGWAYDIWKSISDQNTNAVLLFFVLSGFAIRLSLRDGLVSASQNPSAYLARRAFRILPLYWLALAWTAALGWLAFGTEDPSFSLATLAGNVSFLQTSASANGVWFSPFGLNGPLWSLSYEVFYYLLLPLVAVALGGMRDLQRAAAVMTFGSLLVSLLAVGLGQWAPSPFSAFLSYWHVWVLGFVLADAWKRGSLVPYPVVAFLILSLLAQAATMYGQTSSSLAGLQNGAGLAAIGYVIMLAGAKGGARALAWLGRGLGFLFGRLGHGSYALYLLHYPLLLAVATVLSRGSIEAASTRLWIVAAIIIPFAFILCPTIEAGLLRLRPVLFRARRPSASLEPL